jgi:GTP-binding protein Era
LPASLQKNIFATVNKIDMGNADAAALGTFVKARLPFITDERMFKVSALTGAGTEALLAAIFAAAPLGHAWYPAECYTDQEPVFRISEIIRESASRLLSDELPHAIFVDVTDSRFHGENNGKLDINADILVERDSQKGIVVGRGGAMIKAIRIAAEKELRDIFDWKIKLELRAKVGRRR